MAYNINKSRKHIYESSACITLTYSNLSKIRLYCANIWPGINTEHILDNENWHAQCCSSLKTQKNGQLIEGAISEPTVKSDPTCQLANPSASMLRHTKWLLMLFLLSLKIAQGTAYYRHLNRLHYGFS